MSWEREKKELASMLWRKAIRFGEFEFKLHERFPEAPKSSIYISLRRPPKGNLSGEDIRKIGEALFQLSEKLQLHYDHIVGLPKAGEEIANAFKEASGGSISLLRLEKQETEEGRRILPIIHGEYKHGDRVLVIDDVMVLGDTKIEGVNALRRNGLTVKDCLILVNYGISASREMSRLNIQLYSRFTVQELLDFGTENHFIDPAQKHKALLFIKEIKKMVSAKD